MKKDRIKWNKRYEKAPHQSPPSEIVTRFHSLASKGKALDIAAGNGRNALFLAENGFTVDAVDISDEAMNRLSGCHPEVLTICADLDTFEISKQNYSLIINIRYLKRRLFPYIFEGLMPGGLLIFETYMEEKADDMPGVSCRDYLLRDNELLHSFLRLKIIYYEEKSAYSRHGPARIASLAAVKRKSNH